jgi:hypothetical protein
MILDFACAGRDAFFALLALDKIENSPLPLGEPVYRIVRGAADASSNEHGPFIFHLDCIKSARNHRNRRNSERLEESYESSRLTV